MEGGTTAKLYIMKYVFVLFFMMLAAAPSLGGATPGEVSIGGNLRDAPMRGLTGESVSLSEYQGKPLIINVWASYCVPCLAEMGSLERLWRRYGNRINVIGISIDDYPDRAKLFLSKAGTSFPHYIDYKLTLENMLGANTIPLTLLVDEQGRVLLKIRGAQEWDDPDVIKVIGKTYNIKM